ncbi:hypothetical protein F2Q69_00046301 [Brassica cretica]|uniref:CCHC-type domain-containing protein n=1 Tax=Brassica cretica TaxID=69181 RepID=A0A8S9PQ35_BRACR|nr:hypothetical protein F2Q69_00046301 [Brassica cretica]
MSMLSRNFASYLKQREDKIKSGRISDLGRSSSKVQCFECNGFGHVRKECENLLKQKKIDDKNDSDTDSNDGEKLKNFVAFTTFVSGVKTKYATGSATGSAAASVSGSSGGCDDDAESEDDDDGRFDLAGNYKKLYEHWLKLVEENSDLVKELNHLLSIGQSDRCDLGYQGECSKAEGAFVSAGKTKDLATFDTKPEVKRFAGNATNGKTAAKPANDVKNVAITRTATSTATATATATAPATAP